MAIERSLLERQAERDSLLRRLIAALEADERVVAAWLAGSFGRETADEWSDLDLWVVVEDRHADAVIGERREVIAAVGTPLLVLDAPQNAPPGGAYLLALYPGHAGPTQVDWYWQPRSRARLPPGCHPLFDRVGVPPLPPPAPLLAEERAAALSEAVARFSVAVLIAGKNVARRRPAPVGGALGWAVASLAETRWLIERGTAPDHDAAVREGEGMGRPHQNEAHEQLALLRELCRQMDALAPEVERLGGRAPVAATRQVAQFLEFVASELDQANR